MRISLNVVGHFSTKRQIRTNEFLEGTQLLPLNRNVEMVTHSTMPISSVGCDLWCLVLIDSRERRVLLSTPVVIGQFLGLIYCGQRQRIWVRFELITRVITKVNPIKKSQRKINTPFSGLWAISVHRLGENKSANIKAVFQWRCLVSSAIHNIRQRFLTLTEKCEAFRHPRDVNKWEATFIQYTVSYHTFPHQSLYSMVCRECLSQPQVGPFVGPIL